MKPSKRRIYHHEGHCCDCLWGPIYDCYNKTRNWCSWHKKDIEDPQTERCNQFYRADCKRNKK